MPSAPAPARASSPGPVYDFLTGSLVFLSAESPTRNTEGNEDMHRYFYKDEHQRQAFWANNEHFLHDKTETISSASSPQSSNRKHSAYAGNSVF